MIDHRPFFEYMAVHNLTIAETAKRAGVDPATFSNLLYGPRQPHIRTVHQVCTRLGIDPASVFIFRFDHAP
ncbi:MAG: helix-turn-helix transcriptional regulator [Candidatus Dormibacteraeota bacterium]|nr:helix-turn-helix transcriptional regulator [Candidatus Dormibacteraeota bacterium]